MVALAAFSSAPVNSPAVAHQVLAPRVNYSLAVQNLFYELFLSSWSTYTELAFLDITLRQKHNAVAALRVITLRQKHNAVAALRVIILRQKHKAVAAPRVITL